MPVVASAELYGELDVKRSMYVGCPQGGCDEEVKHGGCSTAFALSRCTSRAFFHISTNTSRVTGVRIIRMAWKTKGSFVKSMVV